MSRSRKKSPIKKLISFAVIVILISLLAFVPTIYQSIQNSKDLAVLFDKYGFSYDVNNRSNAFASCSRCGYIGLVESEKNGLFACPYCSSNNQTVNCKKYYVNYLYGFTKISASDKDNAEAQVEAGSVYIFDSSDFATGCELLKKYINDESRIFITKENSVFVLNSQPSEELSTIIDKLGKVK